MKLTSAVQESLLTLACYDATSGGGRLVPSLISCDTFDPYYKELAVDVYQYIKQYEKVPGDHTLDIFNSIRERHPESFEVFSRIYESMRETREGINREYIFSQARVFARYQRVKKGIADAIEGLKQDDEAGVVAAETSMTKSLTSAFDLFDPGVLITDAERSLRFLEDEYHALPTGIPELDRCGHGPGRKKLHLLSAMSGYGKSWWLLHLAKIAIVHGLRVVYLTWELSEEEASQRIMQSFFSISKRKAEVEVQRFKTDELGRFTGFDTDVIKDRPNIADPNIRNYLVDHLKLLKNRPKFYIKQFPTGGAGIPELEGYLNSLEGSQNFVPDLVLVDYPDLFRMKTGDRQEIGMVYKELRGLAVKRNLAVAAVTQSNRAGYDVKVLKGKHAAEDITKYNTSDVYITFNQTDSEKKLGLARLSVEKCRSDEDKQLVLISQSYKLGQFCMSSTRMSSVYWNQLPKGDEEQEEKDAH